MDIAAIRAALAVRLGTIPGLNPYAAVPGSVSVPAAVVVPGPGTFVVYNEAMEGLESLQLGIVLALGYAHQEGSQANIDEYVSTSGAKSIWAAVNGDMSLGGAVHYATVTEARNYGIVTINANEYLGCEFGVTIGTG